MQTIDGIAQWNIQTTNPAAFLDSSSLRKSAILSWKLFPANLSGWAVTFSLGGAGRSLSHTRSTRFCWTPTNDEPLFLRVSVRLRAPPIGVQFVLHLYSVACSLTSRDQSRIDTDHLATLGLSGSPSKRPFSSLPSTEPQTGVFLTIPARWGPPQLRASRAPSCCPAVWQPD